jgi:hypothetical protein
MQTFITHKAWRRTVLATKANTAETSVFATNSENWLSVNVAKHAYALGAEGIQEPFYCEDGVWRVVGDHTDDLGFDGASETLEFAGFRLSRNALVNSIAVGNASGDISDLSRVLNKFLSEGNSLAITEKVCHWGGSTGNRVWGNLVRYHGLENESGRAHFRQALINWLTTAAIDSDAGNAIATGAQIRGLGISYASKHLRLLYPEKYATLDSVISDRLGFAENVNGYRLFIGMLHDFRSSHRIEQSIGDIEFGIFVLLQSGEFSL